MKTISSVLFLIAIILVSSCKKEVPPTTGITVLIDVSDEKFRSPDFVSGNTASILKIMKIDNDEGKFAGGSVKFSLINDISDSQSQQVSLKTGKPGLMGENPLIRNDEVNKFISDIESVFTKTVNSAEWGTDESKIYQKVARELNNLNEQESDRKVLIIYSDMLENSSLFSFYGPNAKTAIEKYIATPNETLEEFSRSAPKINTLNNIGIIIITNRNNENDNLVNLSERFWTAMFSNLGATVSFSSSLNQVFFDHFN
ncbi:MAG: hypothetical protein JW833_14960 [Prolixibacteraceae bacterium]|nr:hypothetical protein [Prolixibacteraceae bacterium]